MAGERDTDADLKRLAGFAESTEKLLKTFQKSRVLDAETKSHQAKLEKLLETTNKIMKGEATAGEAAGFDDLVAASEMSLQVLHKSKKDDKQFQSAMQKSFGGGTNQGSIARDISRNMSASVSDIVSSAAVVNAAATRDVADVSADFLGGPLGKIAAQAIDTDKISQAFSGDSPAEEVAMDQRDTTNELLRGVFDEAKDDDSDVQLRKQIGTAIAVPTQRTAEEESLFQRNVLGDEDVPSSDLFTSDSLNELIAHDALLHKEALMLNQELHDELLTNLDSLDKTFKNIGPEGLSAAAEEFATAMGEFRTKPILVRSAPIDDRKQGLWQRLFEKQQKTDTDILKGAQDRTTVAIKGTRGAEGIRGLLRNINTFGGVRRAQRLQERQGRGELTGISGFFAESRIRKAQKQGLIGESGLRQQLQAGAGGGGKFAGAQAEELSESTIKFNNTAAELLEQIAGLLEDGLGISRRIADEVEEQVTTKGPGIFSKIKGFFSLGLGGMMATMFAGGKKTIFGFIKKLFNPAALGTALRAVSIPAMAGAVAFFVGNFVGKNVVKPVFDMVDKFFGNTLSDAIASGIIKMGVVLEKIPGFTRLFGTNFTEQAAMVERNKEAARTALAEEARIRDIHAAKMSRLAEEEQMRETEMWQNKVDNVKHFGKEIADNTNKLFTDPVGYAQANIPGAITAVKKAPSQAEQAAIIANNLLATKIDKMTGQQVAALRKIAGELAGAVGNITTPGVNDDPGTRGLIGG